MEITKVVKKPEPYHASNDWNKRVGKTPQGHSFQPKKIQNKWVPNKEVSIPSFQVKHYDTAPYHWQQPTAHVQTFHGGNGVSSFFSKVKEPMYFETHRPSSYYEWGGKFNESKFMADNWTLEKMKENVLTNADLTNKDSYEKDALKVISGDEIRVTKARSQQPGFEEFMNDFWKNVRTESVLQRYDTANPQQAPLSKREKKVGSGGMNVATAAAAAAVTPKKSPPPQPTIAAAKKVPQPKVSPYLPKHQIIPHPLPHLYHPRL